MLNRPGKIASDIVGNTEAAKKALASLQRAAELTQKSIAQISKEALAGSGAVDILDEKRLKSAQNTEKTITELTKAELSERVKAQTQAIDQSFAALAKSFPHVKAFAVAESLINSYQAATKALASAPPPLNFILMAATLASGLAQVAKINATNPGFVGGGYTGDGTRFQQAGAVHKGEIVFEKPLVDKNKSDLLAIRSAMQKGATAHDLFVKGNDTGTMNMLVAELRALRNDIRALEIQQPIVFQNVLQGQTFLKKEMPGYENFKKGKLV